jgi:hypothetical protein
MKWITVCAVLFSVAAWLGYGHADNGRIPPAKATAAYQTIVTWLECVECTEGELAAVVKLGRIAVPSLAASLHEGPSPASLELLRRQLIASHGRLIEYAKAHPEVEVSMDIETYVATYMDNYVALYQVRSAMALAEIGGEEAKEALEIALDIPMREDASNVVLASLEKLLGAREKQ